MTICAALASVAGIAPAAADARIKTWVECGPSGGPSHDCYQGDLPTGYFRADHAHVRYHMCQYAPDGEHKCRYHRTGDAGKRQRTILPIHSNELGTYKVHWSRHGKRVGAWDYVLHSEGV